MGLGYAAVVAWLCAQAVCRASGGTGALMGRSRQGLLPVSRVVSSNMDKDHLDQLCLLVQNVPLLNEAHERAASACLPETKNKAAV